jgi:hypothetical protein
MVTIETAIVYRGGRRRWLSMAAAVRAEAKELYRQRVKAKDRCDCEEGSYEGPGPHTCKYHSYDTDIRERFIRLVSRSIAALATPTQGEPK